MRAFLFPRWRGKDADAPAPVVGGPGGTVSEEGWAGGCFCAQAGGVSEPRERLAFLFCPRVGVGRARWYFRDVPTPLAYENIAQ